MSAAHIRRLVEQDNRVSAASAEVHCTIRDGNKGKREIWTAEELADLQDIEVRLQGHLDRLRARLRAELDAENRELYPQQPGRAP